MSHTKGPWKVDDIRILIGEVTLSMGGENKDDPRRKAMKYEPAVAGGGPWSRDETGSAELESNARLIAAAPEMLDFLKELQRDYNIDADQELYDEFEKRLGALIAKAERK